VSDLPDGDAPEEPVLLFDPPTIGALRSFVWVGFNLAPKRISFSKLFRSFSLGAPPPNLFNAGGGPGGGGAAGGGGGGGGIDTKQ